MSNLITNYNVNVNGVKQDLGTIIQNNSTYVQPPLTQSIVLDAIVSDASLTLIGIDDLQLSNINLSRYTTRLITSVPTKGNVVAVISSKGQP